MSNSPLQTFLSAQSFDSLLTIAETLLEYMTDRNLVVFDPKESELRFTESADFNCSVIGSSENLHEEVELFYSIFQDHMDKVKQ